MDGSDTVAALRSAFDVLAPIAPPARLAIVLRRAVRSLLKKETVPDEVSKHSGSVPTSPRPRRKRDASQPSLEAWRPIRDQALAELTRSGMSRRQLAHELKIPAQTLRPALLPHARPLGPANTARIRRWLDHRPAPVATDGGVAPQHNGDATTSDTPTKSTSLPPYRLTAGQRELLAGFRSLDERTLRKSAGVALETVDAAIAGGRDLAPEIIAKLALFLEQQPGV